MYVCMYVCMYAWSLYQVVDESVEPFQRETLRGGGSQLRYLSLHQIFGQHTLTHTEWIHTYIHSFINTHIHTCIHTLPTYIQIHIHLLKYKHTYVHTYIQHTEVLLSAHTYLVKEVQHEVPVHQVFEVDVRLPVGQPNEHIIQQLLIILIFIFTIFTFICGMLANNGIVSPANLTQLG